MSRIKNDTESWTAVMSQIIENLGPNIKEARYEFSKSDNMVMSNIHYVCVKFKNTTNGRSEQLSMILKRPISDKRFRELIDGDAQFNNEIVFYRLYAQPHDNFARCFYAKEMRPVDTLIALENVSERGYRNCPYSYDPPLDHTLAAMRELGRFHGKGYVMKEQQPERFFDIVGRLEETRYREKLVNGDTNYLIQFLNFIAPRAVEYLRSRGHDTVFCDKVEVLLSNAFERVMLKTTQVSASEPLSTVCHGDFTLSNILFKTESDGQHRVMLIDFAFLRYGTPVVDLSTYFCLHCSNETKRDKFFDIMKVYHDALTEYLREAGIRNVERYSYELLLDDYRKGGLFGFVIANFYLAITKGYGSPSLRELPRDVQMFANDIKRAGGDGLSKDLADMLLEMNGLGCLKYFL